MCYESFVAKNYYTIALSWHISIQSSRFALEFSAASVFPTSGKEPVYHIALLFSVFHAKLVAPNPRLYH